MITDNPTLTQAIESDDWEKWEVAKITQSCRNPPEAYLFRE